MFSRKVLMQRLTQAGFDFTSSIAEQALLSDTLRPIIMRELEKRLLSQIEALADPARPRQVTQDKIDLARALIRSAERALARKQISRHVLHRLLEVFLKNTVLDADDSARVATEEFIKKHGTNPPVTMVISPTKVCNLKCIGCYAACSPGNAETLDWETFNRVVDDAKRQWGLRFITISGGEPLAYRSNGYDLIDFVKRHNNCFFQMYTNGTLIDERMAERMAEAGNLIPNISVEGFEERTDERRGKGTFKRILKAMENLRKVGVPYGISLTATCHNAEEILSDEFIDFFFNEQQVIYAWLFQYMPIGRSYTLDLLPRPEQRVWMWKRTWEIVREKQIMIADFWNCGTASDGCIAGARSSGYMYIDWNGKMMPCVFVPYSAGNIKEIYQNGGTLDDIYDVPYFRAIREWQAEYGLSKRKPEEHGNWLVPCSIRDHYDVGRRLIDTYKPEPEDENAAEALLDGQYYEGMLAYDEELYKLFDPIWQEVYLKSGPSGPIQEKK
ncbi:MAG: radical SAM protein [Ardenticatenia bacterium]|nr:MAG: radical SAM protein [Ardenticatenia bacterium]